MTVPAVATCPCVILGDGTRAIDRDCREHGKSAFEPRADQPDHAYLSPGDTHAASGDVRYRGCFLCGRSKGEHYK